MGGVTCWTEMKDDPPLTDLLGRLYDRRGLCPDGYPSTFGDPLCREAAAEIERLRSMIHSGSFDGLEALELEFWRLADRNGLADLPSDLWEAIQLLMLRAERLQKLDGGVPPVPLNCEASGESRHNGGIAPSPPPTIYAQFSDCGQHIRKWSREPFDGATSYASEQAA